MRPTKERLEEIRKEFEQPFNWFCSDWIKDLAQDLLNEVDALTEELKWRRQLEIIRHTKESGYIPPVSSINNGEVF